LLFWKWPLPQGPTSGLAPGSPAPFWGTISGVEIRPSARRHGVADEDIHHAFSHALREVELDEGRWWSSARIGPPTSSS
jgi:hypothetical protein